MRAPAFSRSRRRFAWVAGMVPFPGIERPRASVRQFIELAVNIPEQEPQVGHAPRSRASRLSSLTFSSAARTMTSTRSTASPSTIPASIGPPDTNMAGMLSLIAAMSMPGVTLSQFDMHTIASARCAFTIYSTESAISSREGREYSIPSCPIAMPSSMAIVLNSAAKQPVCSIARFTIAPARSRWTWPGTNWVKELTMAMMGRPKLFSSMPFARHNARAPAIRRPWVLILLLNGIFIKMIVNPE